MTRLVNEMRDTILTGMIKHTFGDDIAAMHKRQAAIAIRIYNDVFSVADRNTMDGLPDGWLPTDDDIFIKIEADGDDEHMHRFRFDGNFSRFENTRHHLHIRSVEAINYRFPQRVCGNTVKVYAHKSSIGRDARDILDEAKALHTLIDDAIKSLRATLDTFFTVEKLTDAWPEVAPFVPEPPAPVAPPQPVALPTAQLNKLFKLPVRK